MFLYSALNTFFVKSLIRCRFIIISICALLVSFSANAYDADKILGTWKAMSTLNGEEVCTVRIRKNKKNNTYFAQVISQNTNHSLHRKTCHKKCPKNFKNKPIKGMTILWDLKAKNPKNAVYTDGYGLDPWQGKVFRGTGKLMGSKGNILKLRGSLIEAKWLGQTFSFIRAE